MIIRLRTLGPPRCTVNTAEIDFSARPFSLALLSYLAVERQASLARVFSLLWPELPAESAQAELKVVTADLDASLGSQWSSRQDGAITIGADVAVDALEFESLIARGEVSRANALYAGDFLQGFSLDGCPNFDLWLDSKRADLRRLHDPVSDEHPEASATALFGELKRRRVFRMAAWYSASVFVAIQVAQSLSEALYLPPIVLTATAVLGIIGFPLALLLSWLFDITPEGIIRAEGQRASFTRPDWRMVAISLAVIVVAAAATLTTSAPSYLLTALDRTPPLRCLDGSRAPCSSATAIEPNRFAVLPLSHEEGAEHGLLDGEMCARLLAEGLGHWHDINVADEMRINEALRRLPDAVRLQIPVDTGISIARGVGAGKLIMGELWHYADSTRVSAALYDVISGRMLKQQRTRFRSGSAEAQSEFYKLAQLLVLEDGDLAVGAPIAAATQSYAALLSYDSALKAIRQWDLPHAKQHFTAALQRDPNYAYAHLSLAHVLLWQRDTSLVFRHHAARALANAAALGPAEQLLAAGISALANGRYAEACARYRELLARDSASFHAWYGLSECLAGDPTVVADANSPSGWSFASSYEAAIRAHQQALLLVPSFNAAFINLGSSRLASLLFLNPSRFRRGIGAGEQMQSFAAWPELSADTLALIPYPHEQWTTQPIPATNSLVLARHRSILRDAATRWAGAFPANTNALEALAVSLEQSGEIAESDDRNSALSVIKRARTLETDSARKLRFGTAEVRLLVKAGRYKQARKLAGRMLQATERPEPAEALRLAGMAALSGKPHMMAQLLVQGSSVMDYDSPPSGEELELPRELAQITAELLAYAYFNTPHDSIAVLMRRAHAVLDAHVAAERRAVFHSATLNRAARITFPVLGPDEVHRDGAKLDALLAMQALLANNDRPALLRALMEYEELQRNVAPGELAADGVLTHVQLRLAVADTARAVQLVDAYLNDLVRVPAFHFRQPYQPVALVRLMALRAELAARRGERAIARKWSRAVVDLWRDGDREVQPTLRRMRSLARS